MRKPTTGINLKPSLLASLVFLLKAALYLLFHGIINFAGVTQKIIVPRLGNPFKVFLQLKLPLKIQRVP